jgi:putative MFS transporter
VLVFPDMVDAWGVSGALWLFVAAGLLGLVTTVLLAPETKNRSLEQTAGARRVFGGTAPAAASPGLVAFTTEEDR